MHLIADQEQSLPIIFGGPPVHHLSSAFNNCTNSYKFFWFLSILNNLQTHPTGEISIDDICLRMISMAWHPVVEFRLSFGTQDQIPNIVNSIQADKTLIRAADSKFIYEYLKGRRSDKLIADSVQELSRYVPFRFLSPWFEKHLRGLKDSVRNSRISQLIESSANELPMYRISSQKSIVLHTEWIGYLRSHYRILSDFAKLALVSYFERHNPNTPNITQKLIYTSKRDLKAGHNFWKTYFHVQNKFACIYSQKEINISNYSLDHFMPWSFVGHDKLWNLIPTLKEINSSKGDCIPAREYFEVFCNMQFDAFQVVSAINGKEKLLEDYTLLFKMDCNEIISLNRAQFVRVMVDIFSPIAQMATNVGFQCSWKYYSVLQAD